MADKRYYWLKLKEDFFDLDTIDYLSSLPKGCEYIVLYQKLCLLTLNSGGRMCSQVGEMLIKFDENKIARDTKFSVNTVSAAMAMFRKIGLIYEENDGVLRIPYVESSVGSETQSAERVRKHRSGKKGNTLQCNTETALQSNGEHSYNVTQILDTDNRDKRIDKKDNKKNYADAVALTEEEYTKLTKEHSKPFIDKCIEVLNNYKLSTGKKYKSDYHAILSWVLRSVKEKYPSLIKQGEALNAEALFENPWADEFS